MRIPKVCRAYALCVYGGAGGEGHVGVNPDLQLAGHDGQQSGSCDGCSGCHSREFAASGILCVIARSCAGRFAIVANFRTVCFRSAPIQAFEPMKAGPSSIRPASAPLLRSVRRLNSRLTELRPSGSCVSTATTGNSGNDRGAPAQDISEEAAADHGRCAWRVPHRRSGGRHPACVPGCRARGR